MDWDKKRIGNSDENNRVPQVLSEIVYFLEESGLKTEGILRKCGSAARMKLLKQVSHLPITRTLIGLVEISFFDSSCSQKQHSFFDLLRDFSLAKFNLVVDAHIATKLSLPK